MYTQLLGGRNSISYFGRYTLRMGHYGSTYTRKDHNSSCPESDLPKRREESKKQKNSTGQKTKALNRPVDLNITSYYGENGLRKTYPFLHTFTINISGRFTGRSVMDLYTKDFFHSPQQVRNIVSEAAVLINHQPTSCDYILRAQDTLTVTQHRHERPVLDVPIKIIEDTEDILVVDKPPSMPVYPCGRYHFNTVVFILHKEFGYENLRTIHRLDRKTSGVLILPKNELTARSIGNSMLNRKASKTYVCRVQGEFPDKKVDCHAPIYGLCKQLGLQIVDRRGKDAHTTFSRLSYNGKTSVVKCELHTGRGHQLRVHLQYLGHPIVYDDLYDNLAWGPEKGKNGVYWKKGLELRDEVYYSIKGRRENPGNITHDIRRHFGPLPESKLPPFDPSKLTNHRDCVHCETPQSDPDISYCMMFLHALSHQGPQGSFSAELPIWAKDDWID